MKAEEEIAEMLTALLNLDAQSPPGFELLGKARLEGMQIALAWALNGPLPGAYPGWFQRVQSAWQSGQIAAGLAKLQKHQERRRRRERTRVKRPDAFCE